MAELWTTISELVIDASPARIESAATAIAGLDNCGSVGLAKAAFGPNLSPGLWTRFTSAWAAQPATSSLEVAAALLGGARVGQQLDGGQNLSLVWTGPTTEFVAVRSTEQVMLEIIHRARSSLFLVSFVNHGAATIVNALNAAAARGVRICLLLEESKGGAEKMTATVPTALVYVWEQTAKLEAGSPEGASVHAKCVVADGEEALITSANLTNYALEKNMELGVHIIGGREPRKLNDHLNALVDTKRVQLFGTPRAR